MVMSPANAIIRADQLNGPAALERPGPGTEGFASMQQQPTTDARVRERFWAKVDKQGPSDCWPWTACLVSGYGMFGVDGKGVRAHRFAYELLVGPIPEGLTLDHLCRNRACVNPAHLDPVTHSVNILRGYSPAAQNARKTHCKRGHPLSGDNLYVRADGERNCRACIELAYRTRYYGEATR